MGNQNPAKNGVGKKKIFIVDDHPVVREGISIVVDNEPDLIMSGQVDNFEEAVRQIEESSPDLVIVDISLKEKDGLELIKTLKTTKPDVPTLVLSGHDELLYAERSIHAGAMGYVMKEEKSDIVLKAIRQVLSGNIYLSEKMTQKIMMKFTTKTKPDNISPFEALSDRELEVFRFIGQGFQNSDIASRLNLSPKTVQVYCEHIKKKLNLKNTVQLHQAAFEWFKKERIT